MWRIVTFGNYISHNSAKLAPNICQYFHAHTFEAPKYATEHANFDKHCLKMAIFPHTSIFSPAYIFQTYARSKQKLSRAFSVLLELGRLNTFLLKKANRSRSFLEFLLDFYDNAKKKMEIELLDITYIFSW